MNAMIPMYVYTANFFEDRVDAIKERYQNRERGASAIEYVGLIVLAAVVVGALFTAIKKFKIDEMVLGKLNTIFNDSKK